MKAQVMNESSYAEVSEVILTENIIAIKFIDEGSEYYEPDKSDYCSVEVDMGNGNKYFVTVVKVMEYEPGDLKTWARKCQNALQSIGTNELVPEGTSNEPL